MCVSCLVFNRSSISWQELSGVEYVTKWSALSGISYARHGAFLEFFLMALYQASMWRSTIYGHTNMTSPIKRVPLVC